MLNALRISCIAITFAFSPSLVNAKVPLDKQLENALNCKTKPVDGRVARVKKTLEKNGIRVVDEEPGGSIQLQYIFDKPLSINGVQVSGIYYLGDSGSIFYAVAKGDPVSFAQKMDAIRTPDRYKENFSYGPILVSDYYKNFKEKLSDENPRLFIIGKDKEDGQFRFGCLMIDG